MYKFLVLFIYSQLVIFEYVNSIVLSFLYGLSVILVALPQQGILNFENIKFY